MRTLLSEHGRLAAGALVGAATAALFVEGILAEPPDTPTPVGQAAVSEGPEPLPPLPGRVNQSTTTLPPSTTTTPTTTTTTTTKRPSPTTTTTVVPTTTTTTTTVPRTTTTTTRPCRILC